jgi:glycosyltransferase involved in cell wall biosynthesis
MHSILASRLSQEYAFDVFDKSDLSAPQVSGSLQRNFLRIRRWVTFYLMLVRGDYAFVHMQGSVWAFKGVVVYMVIARLANARILLHLHGTDWKWFYGEASLIRRWITKMGLHLPQEIVVLYKEWAQKIGEVVPAAQVAVIQNWLSPDLLPEAHKGSETRIALNIDPDDFVVCTVGTVGWRKGTFEILKAVREIAQSIDAVRFVFAGSEETPGEWNEIMGMVQENNLERWVRFPGELDRESVLSLLSTSQVFLLPSYAEGMPIAIIEAMKTGIAIITTPVGGIPDMVEDGVSALLIPPGAPKDIAEAVLRLHCDPGLRSRLAAAAMKAFGENFDASQGVDRLEKIYSKMTETKGN